MKNLNILITILCLCLFSNKVNAQTTDSTIIWLKLDSDPEFPGGDRALSSFWDNNFNPNTRHVKSKNNEEGRIEFTIDKQGLIKNIVVVKPIDPELDAAAVRAVSKMPKWKPAVFQGKPVESSYKISYWIQKPNFWTGNAQTVELPEDSNIRDRGWDFGLWLASVYQTKDFGEYISPFRLGLGLRFGYNYKRLGIGFEYDIIAFSSVRKTFKFEERIIDPALDYGLMGINVFLPINYKVYETDKWAVSPFIAPTLNTLTLKDSKRTDSGDYASFSYSIGLNIDYKADRSAIFLRNKDKKMVTTSSIRTCIFVNPLSFSKANTNSLNGTSFGLRIGIHGFFQKEK
jgi:periplasmic protein TonB